MPTNPFEPPKEIGTARPNVVWLCLSAGAVLGAALGSWLSYLQHSDTGEVNLLPVAIIAGLYGTGGTILGSIVGLVWRFILKPRT